MAQPLNSSSRTCKITILKKTVTGADTGNGTPQSFVAIDTRPWAQKLEPQVTVTSINGCGSGIIITQRYRLPPGINVKRGDRIVDAGTIYDINYIDTKNRNEIIVMCTEATP